MDHERDDARRIPRRTLLAAGGALVAGCVRSGDDGSDRPSSSSSSSSPRTESSAAEVDGRPLVAWLNQGAAADDPWTRAHAAARDVVDRVWSADVRTRFTERVDLGDAAQRTIDELVEAGATLVFATSLALGDDVEAAAERHPDVRFEHCRGLRRSANVGVYTGAYEESELLVGMAAGADTSTGVLGYVAQYPQPEMFRLVNAYATGARSVRPGARVLVAWTGSWWDPEGERRAGESLLAAGADVLATSCSGTGSAEAAVAAAVGWSGHDSDRSADYPDSWLTASIASWDGYYVDRVRALLAGTWSAESYYGTIADGFAGLGPYGARVADGTRARIEARRAAIVDGSAPVFAGPMVDAAGTTRVGAGAVVSTDERLVMDWFVDGVDEVNGRP